MSELKRCPFCGSDKAPELSSIWDCEMCANFEKVDSDVISRQTAIDAVNEREWLTQDGKETDG